MNPRIPQPSQVIADFGQPFFNALLGAVSGAAHDLELQRLEHPEWAVHFSARHEASFLHERIWARMLPFLDDDPRIHINEKGPHRDITLGVKYRARFKRHLPDESIASFPTNGAISFWGGVGELDGLKTLPIAFGYRWDPYLRTVEGPVFSLRESTNKAIWVEDLVVEEAEGEISVISRPAPELPMLDLSNLIEESEQDQAQ